jgi:hypothetical protein
MTQLYSIVRHRAGAEPKTHFAEGITMERAGKMLALFTSAEANLYRIASEHYEIVEAGTRPATMADVLAQLQAAQQRIADLDILVKSMRARARAAEAALLHGKTWEQYHDAQAEASWKRDDADVDGHNRRAMLLRELTAARDEAALSRYGN